jgi:WD40 repeat protein
MFRWIIVCLLLSATAVGLVWLISLNVWDPNAIHAETDTTVKDTKREQLREAPPSLAPARERISIELKPFSNKGQPGESLSEPVIIPNGTLVIDLRQEVPSEKEGKIIFIGTDVMPDEVVPAEKQLPKTQFGVLAIPMGDNETPLPTDKVFQVGNVRYRQVRDTDPLEPNKVQLFKETRTVRKLQVGDKVKRGQLLALVNPEQAFDKVASQVAKVEEADADRLTSRAFKKEFEAKLLGMQNANRNTPNAVPQDTLRETQLQITRYAQEEKQKEKKILVAQRELSASMTEMKQHEIRASIDGTIKLIYKNTQGDAVKPLEAIMQIQNPDRLRVEGLLDVQEAFKLQEGAPVIVEPSRPEAPRLIISGHLAAVTCVAVSTGKRPVIVSGSDDETLRGWDSVTGEKLWLLEGLKSAVRAVACTPVGSKHNLVLFGCADGTGRLLDLDKINGNEKPRDLAERHQAPINGVAFSPDGSRCATCSDDRTICLWKTETGELLHRLPAVHRNAVTSVQFAADKRLVSAGRDNRLVVWDVESGKPPVRVGPYFEGRGGEVAQIGVSPDGKIVLFDQGKELRLLSLVANKQIEGTLQNPSEAMNFSTMALFAPDGKSILTNGSAPGKLQLWRTPTLHGRASELRQLVWTKGMATCGAFAPEDSFLVTGTQDHQVLVWTMPEKKEVESRLDGHLILVEKHLDTQSRQVRVWAELQETPSWLIPGSRATIVVLPQKK